MASSIYWPDGLPAGEALPCPLRDPYSLQQRSPVATTDFGIVSRARRVYSDAQTDISLGFVFSAEQWAYFTGFFWYDLAAGTNWFWLPVRAAGTTELREVNFNGQMPQETLVGATYARHTCTVLTRKGTQISDADYLVRKVGGYTAMSELMQALENMVNE